MLIAQIAKNQLDSSTIQQIEDLLGYFENDFPESNTLITASCFPDDITTIGLSGFKVWHGVLTPYNPEGYLSAKEMRCIESLTSSNNLISAIEQCLKTLKNPAASRWEKCFLLRFLLHAVGDIHQPLHCIQLYSAQFPAGDLAGHRFLISGTPYKNLHQLWDAAIGLGDARLKRPLSAADQQWIEELANSIMKVNLPESFLEIDNLNIYDWSSESYQLAIDVVYADLKMGQEPSQDYLAKARHTAQRQIALAGYRLANLLKILFS